MAIAKRTLILLFLFVPFLSQAQSSNAKGIKVENLPNFDLRRFHFGFLLGYNTADFFVQQKPTAFEQDSLLGVEHIRRPGFNLGIITSLNMTQNLSVRFIPTLSFQDRLLRYRFLDPDGEISSFEKPVESTYLEFPVLLKFRSNRINNFAVYLIGGGKYSLDMASQKDVDNSLDDDVVIKLNKADYSYELGGGVDFFLTYFKFGIDLKIGVGLPNQLIDDGTRFSRTLESVRTKNYFLTFTFEG
jgi:hypothetical protein